MSTEFTAGQVTVEVIPDHPFIAFGSGRFQRGPSQHHRTYKVDAITVVFAVNGDVSLRGHGDRLHNNGSRRGVPDWFKLPDSTLESKAAVAAARQRIAGG